jgi:hypothetical protein
VTKPGNPVFAIRDGWEVTVKIKHPKA